MVAGVPLPAAEVAEALDAYLMGRLMNETRRPAGGVAFRSAAWSAVVGRLYNDPGASAQEPALVAGCTPLVGCHEYASLAGRSAATVRGWCGAGRLAGARRVGRDWLIPIDAPPPPDRRKHQ